MTALPQASRRLGGVCYACGERFSAEIMNGRIPVSAFGITSDGDVDAACSPDCRNLMLVMRRPSRVSDPA